MSNLQPIPVDSQLVNNGVKCVVYGGPGVGKTRLALTVPAPIILSAEQGLLSIRGAGLQQLPEIRTLAELINAHNWLLNDKAAAPYQTVVVDSITEIAEVVLASAKSSTKDGRKAHDDASTLVVAHVFRLFRDLPKKHVLMIAKETFREDQYTKLIQYMPDMPNGKLRTALPHYFDFVFRYVHGVGPNGPWAGLQCHADASAVAKCRSGRLAMWEAPHMGEIFNKAMV